jgi:hypothetical protein
MPRWVSQPVPPMGAIKAEGIKNQLGRPDVDRLTVLVREAAQNSWDARAMEGDGPVRFDIGLQPLDAPTSRAWVELVGTSAPSQDETGLPIKNHLEANDVSILWIADRGTDGLGGPTRADEVKEGEPHDYVSFVLNVGDPRDTEFGGGTYGFGKAVFYLASRASSILVHTRCHGVGGELEARLVGCALGPGFEAKDRQAHTGRHWFGIAQSEEGLIEPVRGPRADSIAEALGFPSFGEEETGTTVAVIAPDLDGRNHLDCGRQLADSIAWHLWPKMVDGPGGSPSMTFSVRVGSELLEIHDPRRHPVLREFVQAYEDVTVAGDSVQYKGQPVGRIRLRTTYDPPPAIDEVGREAGFGDGVHHCCLMRTPGLVVEYRAGPKMPDERVWYAGVFRALDAFRRRFRRLRATNPRCMES